MIRIPNPDYYPNRTDLHETFTIGVSRAKNKSSKFWKWSGSGIRITWISAEVRCLWPTYYDDYLSQRRLCFWSYLFICLFVRQQDYLQTIEQICKKLLPDVWLRPRNNPFHFGDDPDYDPDPQCKIECLSRVISYHLQWCEEEASLLQSHKRDCQHKSWMQ